MILRLAYLLFLLAALVGGASAAEIKAVRLGEYNGNGRCVIELSSTATYRIRNASGSGNQVQIEVSGVTKSPSAGSGTGPGLKGVGIARSGKIAVITIGTTGNRRTQDFRLDNPPRIVIDFLPGQESLGTVKPAGTTIRVTQPPAAPSGSWVRRIIIDPGHGGYHKGGLGKINGKEVSEKQLTIKVAEKLERLYQNDPRFEVRLTRREDVYMGLQERTVRASELKGDLFISIHANAVEGKEAQKRAKGFEIWTWNRTANKSAAAKAIERLENDDPSMTAGNNRLLTTMMVDALESQALVSKRVATAIHGRAVQHPYLGKNDRGIDSARFKVLEIYDMPSILVELGFMTHPDEVKLMFSDRFQEDWARILYEGTVRYYEQTDPTFPRAPRGESIAQRSK